jgi:hypothetical protein
VNACRALRPSLPAASTCSARASCTPAASPGGVIAHVPSPRTPVVHDRPSASTVTVRVSFGPVDAVPDSRSPEARIVTVGASRSSAVENWSRPG